MTTPLWDDKDVAWVDAAWQATGHPLPENAELWIELALTAVAPHVAARAEQARLLTMADSLEHIGFKEAAIIVRNHAAAYDMATVNEVEGQ